MAEGLGYPVDYVLAEIRRRLPHRTYDDVLRMYQQEGSLIAQDAFNKFLDDGGDVEPELFATITSEVFGSLTYAANEEAREATVRAGLSSLDTKPSQASIQVWHPRERVSGYQFTLQMFVDISEPGGEIPILARVWYSLRSRDLITFGRMKRMALADFEGQTSAEGSFPGQPILGCVVSGVYKFERK